MRPEIYRIHLPFTDVSLPIHGYGLMIVTGFLVVLWVGRHEVARRGIPDRLSDLGMAFLFAGILGGRTFYYAENYSTRFAGQPFFEFFKIWEGGLVFYGGAIGGLVGGFAFLIWKKLPIREYMDISATLAPIGMAFGRLGCFLNGCCYGKTCSPDFALGVQFPETAPAAHRHFELQHIAHGEPSLHVHPVQLYQAGHDLLLFAGLWALFRFGNPPKGSGMPLGIALYGIGRFFIEGLRGDNPLTVTDLTISQNVSIVLVVTFGLGFRRFSSCSIAARHTPVGAAPRRAESVVKISENRD